MEGSLLNHWMRHQRFRPKSSLIRHTLLAHHPRLHFSLRVWSMLGPPPRSNFFHDHRPTRTSALPRNRTEKPCFWGHTPQTPGSALRNVSTIRSYSSWRYLRGWHRCPRGCGRDRRNSTLHGSRRRTRYTYLVSAKQALRV